LNPNSNNGNPPLSAYLRALCSILLIGWGILALFVAIFFFGNLHSVGMWAFTIVYSLIGLVLYRAARGPKKGLSSGLNQQID